MIRYRIHYASWDSIHEKVQVNYMNCINKTKEEAIEDFKLSLGDNYDSCKIIHTQELEVLF